MASGFKEVKSRWIGNCLNEKIYTSELPNDPEYGYPDGYFDEIDSRLGRKTTEEERRKILLFGFEIEE